MSVTQTPSDPIGSLFRADPTPAPLDIDACRTRVQAPAQTPFDRAALAATGSDRLAWVFAGAYQCALTHTFGVGATRATALCVTEDGGNSPKAIEVRYDDGRLHGTKAFVTMAENADDLLVLATRGAIDGRKDLVLVAASVVATGITFEATPTLPFVPEIPHARVTFEGTPAAMLVEDAWPRIKEFRLAEDIFVLGATTAWFLGLARHSSQSELVARLSAIWLSLRELARANPAAPATHLAYAGAAELAHEAFGAFRWTDLPDGVESLWERDRQLLRVAQRARDARTARARELLLR